MLNKLIAVFIPALVLAATPAAQRPEPKTVWDGIYTASQASEGQVLFEVHCVKCHGEIEPDGPPLKGMDFIERWREDSLEALFTYAKQRMPGDRPGSLDDEVYLKVIAHVLSETGFPAGSEELKVDSVARIQVVGREGPRPLPNLTPVKVVGCLTLGSGDIWMLTQTSAPVRTRTPEQSNPDELKASESRSLGIGSLRLQNMEFLSPPINPASRRGQKLQVKGVLNRRSDGDRLNVTSIAMVDTDCGR